jgi:hypothetical protein
VKSGKPEKLYTLTEAAAAQQVTANDVRDPARWVREKVRALRLPYVKIGRVVKLPHSTLFALRAATTHADARSQVVDVKMPRAGAGRSASTLRALERVAARRRPCG